MRRGAVVLLALVVLGTPLIAAAQERVGSPEPMERPVVAGVRVHGNHTMADEEVLAIAAVDVGGRLPVRGAAEIERRLRESGRFDAVEVRLRYRSLENRDRVHLILVVAERQRLGDEILFLPILGYDEDYGFTYGARVGAVDLFGGGERLGVPLTWGGERRAALELGVALGAGSATHVEAEAGILQREHPHFELDERRVAARAGVLRDMGGPWRLRAGVGWTDAQLGAFDGEFLEYELGVALDTRPDLAYPYDSVYVAAAWRPLHLLGDGGELVDRWRLEARGYRLLVGQALLATRVVAELASAPVPAPERPFLGGAATLRGHRAGAFLGDQALYGGAELRLPLTSPLRYGQAGVMAFWDTGATWDHGEALADARFHHGVGAGAFGALAVARLNLALAFDLEGGTRLHGAAGFTF